MTDPSGYAKTLALPAGFDAPRLLRYDDVTAHAITRDDLGADVRGINASLDLIRETRGGNWPTGPVTEEENFVDLVWHECEFPDGKSFTFCVEAEAAAISAAHTSSRVARAARDPRCSSQRSRDNVPNTAVRRKNVRGFSAGSAPASRQALKPATRVASGFCIARRS